MFFNGNGGNSIISPAGWESGLTFIGGDVGTEKGVVFRDVGKLLLPKVLILMLDWFSMILGVLIRIESVSLGIERGFAGNGAETETESSFC